MSIRPFVQNSYLRARFKEIHPLEKSLVPALEVGIEFTVGRDMPGEHLQLGDSAQSIQLDTVQGYLFWNTEGDNDWTRGFISTGFPTFVWTSQALRDENPTTDCNLIFPLSHSMVSTLEFLRNGRDASFRLFVRVTGHATIALSHFNPPEVQTPGGPVTQKALAGAVRKEFVGSSFHVSRLVLADRFGNQQDIVVPKSVWAEKVLPGLGWGVTKIVELPLAGVGDSMKETDKLLEEAERKFYDGDWTGSLTASRKAVETLQPSLKANINPAHSDRDKGKSADDKADDLTDTFQTLSTAALGYQAAVLRMLHAGAHKPMPGATLERPDAELGLMLAISLRRYVGLRILGGK